MLRTSAVLAAVLIAALAGTRAADPPAAKATAYRVYVSNERSGDVTVIDPAKLDAVATIPVGKRPRGIHPSPDGKTLYVALSGSPIHGPPELDAKGNPVFPDEDPSQGDRAADGIGVIEIEKHKFVRKIMTGSDPEEFAVSRDGKRIVASNEDAGTASVLNILTGKVEAVVAVKKEPEGVAFTPDGKFVYVTCETHGEVFVIDAATNKTVAEIAVGGRPRTVAFLPDGSRAFVPSESAGTLSEIDTATYKIVRVITLPEGSRPMG